MTVDDATFQLVPALVAGLVATFAVLFGIIVMLAFSPVRFPLNPLYLTGSAFSIDTTAAYGWGLGVLLTVGLGYGIVVSAVLTGFQATSLEFLWGAGAGGALAVVTGTTLAYSRSLNRAVGAGQVGDPGPFLMRYGKLSLGQLIATHLIFGSIAGSLYAVLS